MQIKFSVALLLFLTLSVPAGLPDTLTLGCIEFPPLYYTTEIGEAKGELINLAQKLFSKLGVVMRPYSRPAKRLLIDYKNGSFNVWIGMTSLPELNEIAHISPLTVSELIFCSYAMSEENAISSLEQLKGKRVALIRGYSYGEWGDKIRDSSSQINYTEISSHETALKFLNAGRADVLLAYRGPVSGISTSAVPFIETEINRYPLHISVSKRTPMSREILAKLEAAFIELKDNAELKF